MKESFSGLIRSTAAGDIDGRIRFMKCWNGREKGYLDFLFSQKESSWTIIRIRQNPGDSILDFWNFL